MIELINRHEGKYPLISKEERLACLDTTWGSFVHMRKTLRDRYCRESAIPQEDVDALVQQIIRMPYLGGRKGSSKLIEDQKALIGQTMYKEAKAILREKADKELAKRRELSQLERNHKARQEAKEPFLKPIAEKPHDIWSIDFTEIKLLSTRFYICVIYDLYAQGYLSLEAGEIADAALTMEAVKSASAFAGTTPSQCLLSDNGAQFESWEYLELLEHLQIDTLKIPAGEPWHNGEIESGNRDLKKVIWTEALYEACDKPEITRPGVERNELLDYLQRCCRKAKEIINDQLPRNKFDTVPSAVFEGKQSERRKRRDRFVHLKREERQKRMAKLKAKDQKRIGASLDNKIYDCWRRLTRHMTTEKLFAFNELIRERYDTITA